MAYRDLRVYPEGQWATHDGLAGAEAGATLWGLLMARVGSDGRLDDHFQIRLAGSQTITARFAAGQVTSDADLSHYNFVMERRPRDIVMKNNSFTSKWENLEALVAGNRAMAVTEDNANADLEFREAWVRAKAADPTLGVAIRWSVQAHPAYGMRLVLQAMPSTAKDLARDARLSADQAACIVIGSWTATAAMGGEGQLKGPVPTLFSADPVAAEANIKRHPDRLSSGKYHKNFSSYIK
jgi:hypothetical protein